jgi:hypothetical protein
MRGFSDYAQALELRQDVCSGETLLPDRYTVRCRIGRGGRLWMDRVPVRVCAC